MGQPTSAFLQREFVSQLNGKTMLKPITSITDLAVFNIRADTLINSVQSVLGRSTLLKRRSYARKYALATKYPLSVEAMRSVESLVFRAVESKLCSSLDRSAILFKGTKYQARLLKTKEGVSVSSVSKATTIWSRSTFNSLLALRFNQMQAGRKKAILGKPYWPYKFASVDNHKKLSKYLGFSRIWHKYTFDTLRSGAQIICRVKMWRFAKVGDKRYKLYFKRHISPFLM